MPYTARLYDPGTPSALEAALAAQVGQGTNPFAGALLTGYSLQRQMGAEATNQATMAQHMADLATVLRQKQIEGATSLGQSALSSGRDIDILNTVGQALGIPIDPDAVARASALAGASTQSDMVNKLNEAAQHGAEAGVTTQSPLLAQAGINIQPTGTPTAISKEQLAANAQVQAAKINAASRVAAAQARGGAGGKEYVETSGQLAGTNEAWKHHIPGGAASAPANVRQSMTKAEGDIANQQALQGASTTTTSGGDSNQLDPDLPNQQKQAMAIAPAGYTLVNGDGQPQDLNDKSGAPVRVFTFTDAKGKTFYAKVPRRP